LDLTPYNENRMDKKFTLARLGLAILSTSLEETAIWAIWRWVLPDFGINWPYPFLIVVMAAWGAFSVWLFILTTRTLRRQRQAGLPSMVGTRGRVVVALNPEGMVKIRGELWGAVADGENIASGEEVLVVAEDGLKLLVRKSDSVPTKH
jgi:membrane protein implicated in regulation of membrane protease activity